MSKVTLWVDIGNSAIKYRLGQATLVSFDYQAHAIEALLSSHWLSLEKPEAIYVANVAGDEVAVKVTQWCKQHWGRTPVFAKSTKTACGVTNGYDNPEQLGIDRWCAMVAAWHKYQKALCVIDCGTATTIDVIDSEGVHQGGLIIPGVSTMIKSLTQHTTINIDTLDDEAGVFRLGKNTHDCINNGVTQAQLGFLVQSVADIQKQYHVEHVLVTGGYTRLVRRFLPAAWKFESELVLQGFVLIK